MATGAAAPVPHHAGNPASVQLFIRLLVLAVGFIHHHRNAQRLQVLFDQRLHVGPVQTADAGGQPRQRHAGRAGGLQMPGQCLQRVMHVFHCGLARLRGRSVAHHVLGEQVHDVARAAVVVDACP
ncbi:conserved hypothetical protein [Ricinus communis]|uniref:Uncharacterized protein n=1 Tax=Ricinus communis TaxID=3988 RepID=B9TF50_RICCO|nr:conserved hypothetical protein [Ricinus communis]